jgi:hypothetical protein
MPLGGVGVPPGMGGGPLPGIGPLGGMHVGPGHPFFSDRMRHPDLGPGGFGGPGHPGGARWDPISEWGPGAGGRGWVEGKVPTDPLPAALSACPGSSAQL